MKVVSFNLFRTLGLESNKEVDLTYVKPEAYEANPDRFFSLLSSADWVLFPEYWQLNSLLYGCECQIFPSPATYRIGHDKIEMSRVAQLLFPINTPQTWICKNTPEQADRIWNELSTPFVAKLPKASQGVGVWLIEDYVQWKQYVSIADSLYVQEQLPIEKDLRIVLVGGEVVASYWRHQSDRSFHTNVSRGGTVDYKNIPDSAIEFVLTWAKTLGINHAGFDIAMVGDRPYFFEFNRLFGTQGIPGGGKTITDAIFKYLLDNGEDHRPLSPNSSGRKWLKIAS